MVVTSPELILKCVNLSSKLNVSTNICDRLSLVMSWKKNGLIDFTAQKNPEQNSQ